MVGTQLPGRGFLFCAKLGRRKVWLASSEGVFIPDFSVNEPHVTKPARAVKPGSSTFGGCESSDFDALLLPAI